MVQQLRYTVLLNGVKVYQVRAVQYLTFTLILYNSSYDFLLLVQLLKNRTIRIMILYSYVCIQGVPNNLYTVFKILNSCLCERLFKRTLLVSDGL